MVTDILQPTHLLILLVVALVVLGPKRLPSAGRAVGQSLREFRGSLSAEQPEPVVEPPELTAKQPEDSVAPTSSHNG